MTEDPPLDRPVSALLVNPDDYETVRQLGKGASGLVYLVKSPSDTLYALKQVKISHANMQQQQYLLREIEVMARATHPCLLQLLGFSLPLSWDGISTIITEYMPRGSLLDLLELDRRGEAPLDWDSTRKLCLLFGLAGGIRYLHQRKIIHRDLKADNILLTESLEPRIADFGLSKLTLPDDSKAVQMTGKIGSPLYMAPELFNGQDYDSKVDVYAFGILMFEVLSGETPFEDVPNPIALAKTVTQGTRPVIPDHVSVSWARLMERCWAQEASARPAFEEIVDILSGDEFIDDDDCDQEFVIAWRDWVFADSNVEEKKEREEEEKKEARIAEIRSTINLGNDEMRTILNQMRTDCGVLKKQLGTVQSRIATTKGKLKQQEKVLESYGKQLQSAASNIQVVQDKQKHLNELARSRVEKCSRQLKLLEVRGDGHRRVGSAEIGAFQGFTKGWPGK